MKYGTETVCELGQLPKMENYLHDGAYTYKDYEAGQAFLRLRMEEHEAESKIFEGEGNPRHLLPGYCFELKSHWEMDAGGVEDRTFLVLEIEHWGWNNYLRGGGGDGTTYHSNFTCIRRKIPYRPSRKTPKAYIRGIQTAIVVGPSGEEIFCDQYGRIRVQLHWDREGTFNDQSFCWVRVGTQWAGKNYGMISIPRIGTEVLIDFIDGDPDRPIVTGAVYNAANMPPWTLPDNKTQSGILSRSTQGGTADNANALRFEDLKGKEEVWLHAEKDQRIEVENDESHWVGHDRKKNVDHDETTVVGHDRTETVKHDENITVDVNRTEHVGGNEKISISGHKTTTITQFKVENVGIFSTEQVGAERNLTVGGAYTIEVGGFMNTLVTGIQATEVMSDQTFSVKGNQTTTVGKNYVLTVDGDLTINVKGVYRVKVGKALYELHPDGTIKLIGVGIAIEGSGPVQVTGNDIDLN
jgi:type VI secretion system secreted protein VgrG